MIATARMRRTISAVGVVLAAGCLLVALPVGGARDDRKVMVRNVVTMREIKFASDWNSDPTAVPQLMHQMRSRTSEQKRWKSFAEPLEMADEEIFRWPFIYITGHDGFEFTDKDRENLRRYVLNGGLVWADDCLAGQSAFMKDFKSELKKVFPEYRLESIKKEDPRFTSIYWLFYEVDREPGGVSSVPLKNLVMLVDGQLGILVTMNDYGCAWEVSVPPTLDEPIGMGMHIRTSANREAVYRFSANLLYYLLTH